MFFKNNLFFSPYLKRELDFVSIYFHSEEEFN